MNTNTNGNPKPSPSHLDKLLEDKPLEFQNKVLRFAFDSGMKENDPAFRLVQYIGYLAQLTESAPEDWKGLFRQLLVELQEWTQITNGQLETAAQQMEVIRRLAINCEALSTALNALDLTSRQQLQQLITLNETLPAFLNVVPEMRDLNQKLSYLSHALHTKQPLQIEAPQVQSEIAELKRTVEILVQSQSQIIKRIERLSESSNRSGLKSSVVGIWNFDDWAKKIGVAVCMLVTAVLASVTIVNMFPPPTQPLSADTLEKIDFVRERVGYNYTKLQRIEDALGIKSQKR